MTLPLLTNDCSDINIYNSYGVFILWYIAIGNYIQCFIHSYYIYNLSPLFFLSDTNLSSQYILYIKTWERGLTATIY